MKVKLLTNLGSNDFPGFPFLDGDEHEVTDELGAKLVRLKLAVEILPPPAKPAPPPVAEAVKAEQPKVIEAAKADKFSDMRAENVNQPKTKPASTNKES